MVVKQALDGIEKLLCLSSTSSLEAESARFTQYERALREETHTLHHDFVSVPIVHQSGVNSRNLVSEHYVLSTAVIFRRKGAKKLIDLNLDVFPDRPLFCRSLLLRESS